MKLIWRTVSAGDSLPDTKKVSHTVQAGSIHRITGLYAAVLQMNDVGAALAYQLRIVRDNVGSAAASAQLFEQLRGLQHDAAELEAAVSASRLSARRPIRLRSSLGSSSNCALV